MAKTTERHCEGCDASLSGRGGKRYCGPQCRPRCSVEGCERPTHAKGWCTAHAARAARTGSPTTPLQRHPNVGACSVDGCEQPSRTRGWCASHHSQWRQTGETRPFLYKWAAEGGSCVVCGDDVKPGAGRRKHCSNACQALDSSHGGQRPLTAICQYCSQEFSLQKRDANGRIQRVDTVWCPECGRDSPDVQRFKRYGVTREQYQAASAIGCRICLRTDKTLHVDHDHKCCPAEKNCCGECVRGFICGPCNRGLGLFFDDAAALRRAADYLDPPP